jgi:pimeloyl-ACP methyl ester carboxylesterase
MSPFTEQRIELASGPLTLRKAGAGSPILHLHGTGGPNFSPMLEALAQRHTIYQPVAPGFDGMPAHASVRTVPDLADLYAGLIRDHLGGRSDVIGLSFGGWVAAWLAARHPDRVAQLVLEGPAGLRDPGTGGLPSDPAALRRALYAVPERAPKAIRSADETARNRLVREGYAGGISLDQALLEALPRISARTLILFGMLDEVCPVEKTGRRLKAGIAHSHLSYIYGAAHAIEYDQPERVARLIGAFLERGEAFLVRGPEAA